MINDEALFLGRTFDDFLFTPQRSPVLTRREVDLSMPLAAGLRVGLPVIGANMDTVMGEEMGKTLALEGAFGFLHRSRSIEEEASQIRYVKSRHSYVIDKPVLLPKTATMAEARKTIHAHKASGILIEESPGSGILAGILSHRDMPLLARRRRPAASTDYMTPAPRIVTRPPNVAMDEAERVMFDHRVEKLPLVDADGRIRGLITMRDLKLYKQKPQSAKDARGRLRVGATIGATGDFIERAVALVAEEADAILMDVAHADSEVVAKAMAAFRKALPKATLVVGNVATADGARRLRDQGADAVKVGVGPGARLPDPARDRGRRAAAPGDPRGLAGGRRTSADHRRRRGAQRQGHLPGHRLRRLDGDAGQHALRHRRGSRHRHRGPGHRPEDEALPRHDVARGRGRRARAPSRWSRPSSTPAEGQSVRVPYVGSVVGILHRVRGPPPLGGELRGRARPGERPRQDRRGSRRAS